MKKYPNVFARKKLLALAVPMLMFGQAQAVEFEFGEASLTVDTQLSIGSSWRMEDQNNNLLNYASPTTPEVDGSTSDDGNRNFENGDAFSQIFKGSHDLQLTYQNYGAFVRAKYWYDSVIENNSVEHGHAPTYTASGSYSGVNFPGKSKLDDSGFNDLHKGSGISLLDAFVYGSFDVAEMPLDVRLGKQVVSWGESTFIQGGINQINPVDAAAFRRPGAEIKEGLLPVNMLYGNLGLTDSLSLEAFYQLEFHETLPDSCGTYFSPSDVFAEGCNILSIGGGALSTTRADDGIRKPSDDGQFGIALRYFSDALDTEFGFYAMNIHERLGMYGTQTDTNDDAAVIAGLTQTVTDAVTAGVLGTVATDANGNPIAGTATWGDLGVTATTLLDGTSIGGAGLQSVAVGLITDGVNANVGSLISATRSLTSKYFFEYPEDKKIVGLSFAGNAYGVAVSGEVSHQIDAPLAINGNLATGASLANGAATAGDAGKTAAFAEYFGDAGKGDSVKGYRLFDITQVQATAIHLVNRVLGASSVAFIAEVGATFVHDLDDVLRYGRSSTYGDPLYTDADDGFVTDMSWGYRAVASAKYTNAFAGVDLSPSINFTHDVEGYGPQFNEDAKTLAVTLKANYLQRYDASIAYKAFMGGKYNIFKDRDFLAISAGVQF